MNQLRVAQALCALSIVTLAILVAAGFDAERRRRMLDSEVVWAAAIVAGMAFVASFLWLAGLAE